MKPSGYSLLEPAKPGVLKVPRPVILVVTGVFSSQRPQKLHYSTIRSNRRLLQLQHSRGKSAQFIHRTTIEEEDLTLSVAEDLGATEQQTQPTRPSHRGEAASVARSGRRHPRDKILEVIGIEHLTEDEISEVRERC
jgi:hypothetical protein